MLNMGGDNNSEKSSGDKMESLTKEEYDALLNSELSEKTYLGKGGKEVKMSKKYKDSIDEFMGA